jgi:hypothetical protein
MELELDRVYRFVYRGDFGCQSNFVPHIPWLPVLQGLTEDQDLTGWKLRANQT